jgi:superfamily I DNA/RNA helicase/mRNA-degrading endonuclease RelE of RelBE toxin-antitoxin system
MEVVTTPLFIKDLKSLQRSQRKMFAKVCELLTEISTGIDITRHLRSETRIPSCHKYDIADGYRMVFQRVTDSETLIALCAGPHDYVDAFLGSHRGWVFDPSTGRAVGLRLGSIADTSTDIAHSTSLISDRPGSKPSGTAAPARATHSGPPVQPGLFADFTDEMLAKITLAPELWPRIRSLTDPNSIETLQALAAVEEGSPQAADLLLAHLTGSVDVKDSIQKIAEGDAYVTPALNSRELASARLNTEEFLCFRDPKDMEDVLARNNFERWQLFLHPAQKELVERTFAGPARIRGVSGSGKTVVALHRARYLAKQGVTVLFTTFNKALAASAGRLLDSLCGQERSLIEVTHLDRWCLDFLVFRAGRQPFADPVIQQTARDTVTRHSRARSSDALGDLTDNQLWSEIEFIYGRFLHQEARGYLETDRSGRGFPLTSSQRQAVLQAYTEYVEELARNSSSVDPREFVRLAYSLLTAGEQPQREYGCVIVDEVQDLSEIALRTVYKLVGAKTNGLLLVGDGTQRIFTSGFSMRNLGIEISGRSYILRKNYRNTRQIMEAALPLISEAWERDVRSDGSPDKALPPECSVREGPQPAIVRCSTDTDELRFIVRETKYLLGFERYTPAEICIMARSKQGRSVLLNALDNAGVPVVDYRDSDVVERDAVRVSTLHSAKGHEYSVVFIASMIEGNLPNPQALEAGSEDMERALLYVAMTRARDLLYLSYGERQANGTMHTASSYFDAIEAYCELLHFPA